MRCEMGTLDPQRACGVVALGQQSYSLYAVVDQVSDVYIEGKDVGMISSLSWILYVI